MPKLKAAQSDQALLHYYYLQAKFNKIGLFYQLKRFNQHHVYKLFKSLNLNSTVDEVLQWIKAGTDISPSDEEIKAILSKGD